jgi:hypothetical protein
MAKTLNNSPTDIKACITHLIYFWTEIDKDPGG